MVSAVLTDALGDPLAVLFSLQTPENTSEPATEFPARVAAHFCAIFKNDDAFKQIPALDVSHPPESFDGRSHPLVRFRAMVQDTSPSPEMYPAHLPDGRPGGWGLAETLESEASLDLQTLREREVIWAISIPGESPFVGERLDDPDYPVSKSDLTSKILRHKDPLSREQHIGIQIKIYDASAAPLKPTELRTFVGFLTFEHASSIEEATTEEALPTIHVLFSIDHPLGILEFAYPIPPVSESVSTHTIRHELIQWISDEALGGDVDAAEWVLLTCIARVQSRQPPLIPLPLTLSRFPKSETDSATPALVHVLRHILPLFVDVPLSLPFLNTRPFSPESRDESLLSGLLQLPAGTTVLLSDSGVQEGKITEAGVKNIQALRTCLVAQTLDYQFPFTAPYQFPTDLSFLVVTEGRQSAFAETHLNLPLECKVPQDCYKFAEAVRLPSPTQLDAYRSLVGGAKTGKIRVTEQISQYIQDDFVRERQGNRAITADDLMTRMAIARLIALSRHDDALSQEVWHRAKELDELRKRRS